MKCVDELTTRITLPVLSSVTVIMCILIGYFAFRNDDMKLMFSNNLPLLKARFAKINKP